MPEPHRPSLPEGVGPHRLFFALWPERRVREEIAAQSARQRRDAGGGGRAMAAERYHLTLSFLGDFQRLHSSRIRRLVACVGELRMAPFVLHLDRFGSFGRQVGWMGCSKPPPQLFALHERLDEVARACGLLSVETPHFVPHVSVARKLSSAWHPAGTCDIRWPVDAFVLMHSAMSRQHAYSPVAAFPLRRSR